MLTKTQREVLRSPGFRRLWLATGLSELASNVGRISFILLVHELARMNGEEPEGQTALVVLIETIPMILLGPVAGALVDRLDKRWLLVGGDIASVVLMLTIPWLATLDSRIPLYCVAMVFSAIGTLFQPARQSAIPDLVSSEQLSDANSISSTTSSVTLIAGMAIASALVENLGKDGTFLLNGITFAISAFMMAGLVIPRHADAPRNVAELLREAAHGLGYLVRQPVLVYLTLGFFLTYCFIGALIPLLPAFCEEFLGMNPDRAPWTYVAFGMGGVLGGVLGPTLGRRFGMGRVAVFSIVTVGFVMVLYASASTMVLSMCSIFVAGALIFTVMVQDATIVQRTVPAHLLGRVFGARYPMQALGYLVATTTILILAETYTPQELMLGAALSYTVAMSAATGLLPGARHLLRRERPAPAEAE